MQASYVERSAEEKYGGRANLLVARGRSHLRTGLAITAAGLGLAVLMTALNGRITFYAPPLLLAGLWLAVRGWRETKEGLALARTPPRGHRVESARLLPPK
jgi:hypothetical protein